MVRIGSSPSRRCPATSQHTWKGDVTRNVLRRRASRKNTDPSTFFSNNAYAETQWPFDYFLAKQGHR